MQPFALSNHRLYRPFFTLAASSLAVLLAWSTLLRDAHGDTHPSAAVFEQDATDEATAPALEPPKGLSASDWAGIRQAYERHRHEVVAVTGPMQADLTIVVLNCGIVATQDLG